MYAKVTLESVTMNRFRYVQASRLVQWHFVVKEHIHPLAVLLISLPV